MTESEIRIKILEVFESKRSKQSAYFDETHFMDFLTEPPHKKNSIKNSFRGVKKYYRFMDKLELEFGICFTLSDLDKYYSVNSITKKVIERIGKPKGNKMILKRRMEEKENYIIELILFVSLVLLFIWLGIHWISLLAALFIGFAIYWIVESKFYSKRHNSLLDKKINAQNN